MTIISFLDPFNQREAGYWDFEDQSVTNTAYGDASTIGHGSNDLGQIVPVPDRDGVVMQCNFNPTDDFYQT